ncbi:hypothetical protein [Bacillus dakarensis]|uniref:hypothetical protein n=1 Tax=Robertmurraya dakarensis TaxID=1926278 RepID=UPI0009815AEB|nr:hypothetical protein [Bacillus dakarensis]
MIYLKKAIPLLAFMFVAIFIIGSFPSITSACSCAELPSVEDEYERSEVIFSGKVIAIKEKQSLRGRTTQSVLFEVMNTWKGVEQSQMIITTGQGGGDCGIDFIEGEEYLVYANDSNMYGAKSLVTTICDRTDVLSSLQEDLMVLGEGQPPIKEVDLSRKHNGSQKYIWAAVVIAIGIVVFFIIRKRRNPNQG